MNITPRSSPKVEPARRAKRQQECEEKKTHKSSQKRQRRHGGSDANIYGEDYGILPSDDSSAASCCRCNLHVLAKYSLSNTSELPRDTSKTKIIMIELIELTLSLKYTTRLIPSSVWYRLGMQKASFTSV